jgi:hypothetical protein
MSVREGMEVWLSDRRTLRACLYLAAALGLALLAVWPRGTLEAAVRTGQASGTFTVVAVCFLIFLLYLGARFGAEDFSADPGVQLRELVTLTPVPLARLVVERFAAGLLHTFVLLLLGAPFLAAAMAVGGVDLPQALCALAIIGAASLAARMAGLCALALLGARRPTRDIVLFFAVTASAAATSFLQPAVSSFYGVAALARGDGSLSLLPAAADLAAAVALAGCTLGILLGVRARAKRRAPGGGAHG